MKLSRVAARSELVDALPLTLELTDDEVEAPREKTDSLDAQDVQRWLVLGFLAQDGIRVTLELEVDARLVHDGIAIASRSEREHARLHFEIDGSPTKRKMSEPEGWTREGDRFVMEGLATADAVLALIRAALPDPD